jgi:hypothetical protein
LDVGRCEQVLTKKWTIGAVAVAAIAAVVVLTLLASSRPSAPSPKLAAYRVGCSQLRELECVRLVSKDDAPITIKRICTNNYCETVNQTLGLGQTYEQPALGQLVRGEVLVRAEVETDRGSLVFSW